jgi:hypothetical protein
LEAQEVDEPSTQLTGSWKATSAAYSVILSIEPSGQALVILGEKGAFSMQRTGWKPLAGGLLVEGLPRFRLWQASHNDRLRAEMHLPEGIDVSESWRAAPRAFFMQRIREVLIPKELSDRPLPRGWEKAALDKEWDLQAGRRRPKN